MRRIAVLSHIVLDEVHPSDVESVPHVEVGGAGAYAAVGSSLAGAAGATVLVSGVGTADRQTLAAWCTARQIDPAGLFDVSEFSPRTVIDYFPDGERVETPAFGLEHFDAHTPLPRHIPFPPDAIGGVYLFHDHEPDYWSEVDAARSRFAAPYLWEISADSCRPAALPAVRERLELVDVLSLNRTEALGLFGAGRLDEALAELARLPVVTVLRLGAAGSLVIDGGDLTAVGVAAGDVVDPTGGGNSYSGAFLADFAATGDPVAAARIAAAAAATVIAQTGAPLVDDDARAHVRAAALSIPTERRPR